MSSPKIVALAGSSRRESWNKKLIRVAADAARAAGGDVTLIDLADFPLPLMDEDLEASSGAPENATRLKEIFNASDGLLFSCPEYNSSITPLLKNTIDWLSRKADGETPLAAFKGKVCGLLAASTGQLGGLRGLVTVRSILGNIGVLVLPDQVAVPQADKAFDDDGRLTDPQRQAAVEGVARKLVEVTTRLRQPGAH